LQQMNPLKKNPRTRISSPIPQKPDWMKINIKFSLEDNVENVRNLLSNQRLNTVCESASCPNLHHCWSRKTATFMIGGDICPKRCTYCDIAFGKPLPLDEKEPLRVAESAKELNLKYVVITAVNRDDLADSGAGHFARTIKEIRNFLPQCKIEVLIPDFKANDSNLKILFDAAPDVINHNIETVKRLTKSIAPGKSYKDSLLTLQKSANAGFVTKSGIILGMGETLDEVKEALTDLANCGVTIATIGQYLQPTPTHHQVAEYVKPHVFEELKIFAIEAGIKKVASGPLVRSSYHADEFIE